MTSKTFSATCWGIEGRVIEIEAASQLAVPGIHITGLPGDVVRESRERVRGCLVGMGFSVPLTRLVVHLSPATQKKQGSQLDLPIALTILAAEGAIPDEPLRKMAFLGELSLDGRLQAVSTLVPLVQALDADPEITQVVIPNKSRREGALLKSDKVWVADHLGEIIDYLRNRNGLNKLTYQTDVVPRPKGNFQLEAIKGQLLAKRALLIALSGRHHLLLIGSPGVGKTLLGLAAADLMPSISIEDAIAITKNYAYHSSERPLFGQRPFRSPHHTISASALLGGGSGVVIPGEVTLAHEGILFLDEFPEFQRAAIEGLREPLQNGGIQLHRIGEAMHLPARFTLIATMNPCPCGNKHSKKKVCRCSAEMVNRYQQRISAAMLDRVDLAVILSQEKGGYKNDLTHQEFLETVERVYQLQARRNLKGKFNGDLMPGEESDVLRLSDEAQKLSQVWMEEGNFSYRAFHKILKIGRTIADISICSDIQTEHLLEARALLCSDLKFLAH